MIALRNVRLGLAIACISTAAANQFFDPVWVPLLVSMLSGISLSLCEVGSRMSCAGGGCAR